MVVDEKDLYWRFADYDDEELLRILTVERARYRDEALAAAEMVLAGRGVAPPTLFRPSEPPPPQGRARPKSPYQVIDLIVDALLLLVVVWGLTMLHLWTRTPAGGPLGDAAFCALGFALLCSARSLRRRWREKQWN